MKVEMKNKLKTINVTATLPKNKQINITLDTQEEIDKMFALLNYTPVAEAIKVNESDFIELKNILRINKYDYEKWHACLCKECDKTGYY